MVHSQCKCSQMSHATSGRLLHPQYSEMLANHCHPSQKIIGDSGRTNATSSYPSIHYLLTPTLVAVSILGLLLGPVYPCAQTIFTRLLPARVQVFAIGFISSAGSSGGAVVPFLTGLTAQAVGTWVLHPICIAFCIVMLVWWAGLPKIGKRTE